VQRRHSYPRVFHCREPTSLSPRPGTYQCRSETHNRIVTTELDTLST